MARLVAESGSLAGKEWKIDPGVTLGREAHNTIGMPDNRKASRDHAKIWRESPGKYSVVDLGSTNGTLVNDEPIKRQALVDGDEVRVGEVTFRFLLDDDEKPKKPAVQVGGPARAAAVLGGAAPGGGGAPAVASSGVGTSAAGTTASTITVKERLLQYQRKDAGGGVARWDVGQTGEGMRWLLYLIVAAVAVGLFFAAKALF